MLPDGWEVKKVKDLFKITRGQVLAMSEIQQQRILEHQYPVYSSQTKNNGLTGFYNQYLFEDAITWTTDGAYAGEVKFRDGKFYCTNVCGVLLNYTGYANKCMSHIINSISKKYVSYVGNPKLMNNIMAEIELKVPPLPEQQKIAKILSTWDEAIEKMESLVELKERRKKGLMNQLLTGRKRFKEFGKEAQNGELADGWKKIFLKDLLQEIKGGGTPSRTEKKYWTQNGIPWITVKDLRQRIIKDTEEHITKEGLENSSSKLIPAGVIILSTRMAVGKAVRATRDAAINQDLKALFPKKDVSSDFLHYLIDFHKNELEALSTGSTVKGIVLADLENVHVLKPLFPEQQKIAKVLSSCDEEIEKLNLKIAHLKESKKGIMQQLLTGKKRVNVNV